MTETHTHCQCDCCSGADCGQDDPDKFAAEQDAIQKAHDEKVRKAERERVLDEFKWMKPACFGRHDASCDTRCAWVVRKRCVDSLRSEQP